MIPDMKIHWASSCATIYRKLNNNNNNLNQSIVLTPVTIIETFDSINNDKNNNKKEKIIKQ